MFAEDDATAPWVNCIFGTIIDVKGTVDTDVKADGVAAWWSTLAVSPPLDASTVVLLAERFSNLIS